MNVAPGAFCLLLSKGLSSFVCRSVDMAHLPTPRPLSTAEVFRPGVIDYNTGHLDKERIHHIKEQNNVRTKVSIVRRNLRPKYRRQLTKHFLAVRQRNSSPVHPTVIALSSYCG